MKQELNKSDYITLMLKMALDHNTNILKIATLYAGSVNDMKPAKQERLMGEIRKLTRRYSESLDELLEDAKETL